jgi:hypothetical protein
MIFALNDVNWEWVKETGNKYQKLCDVSCDDYHAHSALSGCICGPEDALVISKFYEIIRMFQARLESIGEKANYKEEEHK